MREAIFADRRPAVARLARDIVLVVREEGVGLERRAAARGRGRRSSGSSRRFGYCRECAADAASMLVRRRFHDLVVRSSGVHAPRASASSFARAVLTPKSSGTRTSRIGPSRTLARMAARRKREGIGVGIARDEPDRLAAARQEREPGPARARAVVRVDGQGEIVVLARAGRGQADPGRLARRAR